LVVNFIAINTFSELLSLLKDLFGSTTAFKRAVRALKAACKADGGSSCYGAAPGKCCRTCADVRLAFDLAGWSGWERTPLCASASAAECRSGGCPTCDDGEVDAWAGRLPALQDFEAAAMRADAGGDPTACNEARQALRKLMLQVPFPAIAPGTQRPPLATAISCQEKCRLQPIDPACKCHPTLPVRPLASFCSPRCLGRLTDSEALPLAQRTAACSPGLPTHTSVHAYSTTLTQWCH
jgi:hypothetical protein